MAEALELLSLPVVATMPVAGHIMPVASVPLGEALPLAGRAYPPPPAPANRRCWRRRVPRAGRVQAEALCRSTLSFSHVVVGLVLPLAYSVHAWPLEPMDPWSVVEFKRPGVQHGVFRKLKQGRYAQDARLDLHRLTVAQARKELYGFIEEARALSLRTVVVVHGKGRADPTAPVQGSVLKACVDRWLRQLDAVQAFHSAQPPHGGTGAVYVLLAKSEQAKRENRERFLKGRS